MLENGRFYKKIPAGMMIVPIFVGILINTFFPDLLKIGNPTEILFTSKGIAFSLGLAIFFAGTQIKMKELKKDFINSFTLVFSKLFVAYILSFIMLKVFETNGLIGISVIAFTAVITSTNGMLFLGIVDKYNDKKDYTTFALIALYSMPILPVVFLTASGGLVDYKSIISLIVPLILGIILGNIDNKWTELFKNGNQMIMPIMGLQFGSLVNIRDIVFEIPRGLLLVIIFYIIAFTSTYFIDKYILKNDGHAAIATCSVAGGAISIPYFIIELIPSFSQYMSSAVAQISVAMLITTFVTPVLTNYVIKRRNVMEKLDNL